MASEDCKDCEDVYTCPACGHEVPRLPGAPGFLRCSRCGYEMPEKEADRAEA